MAAFDTAGAITWTRDHEDARAALVAAWKRDTAAEPDATRFVFAYTNVDVDALNAELRQVRRDRGELAGDDTRFETKHGEADFAPGDRVQFTDTLKLAGIYNGNVGTITAIDAGDRRDPGAAGRRGAGRRAARSNGRPRNSSGFRHGYAGTIYKGQGKTLDHTYLYHTHHWRSAASYVALTRQRESAQVFVATGNGARRGATRAADGARRDQGGLGRLGHGGRTDAGTARPRPRSGTHGAGRAGAATGPTAGRRARPETAGESPRATAHRREPPRPRPGSGDERPGGRGDAAVHRSGAAAGVVRSDGRRVTAAPEILIPALRGSGRARQSRPGVG